MLDRADHPELDDVAAQLGIDDDLQRLEDLVSVGMGLIVAEGGRRSDLKTDGRPEAPRRLREERVLLLPARL